MAAREDLPPVGLQPLLFELGAVLDAMGRYEEAFGAFARANGLESRLYDIAGQSAAIDRVVAEWSRDAVAAAPRAEGAGANGRICVRPRP